MDERQDVLIKEPAKAENSLQKSTTPLGMEQNETLTWTKAEKLGNWISSNGNDAHVENDPSSRNAQILVFDASYDGENERKFETEHKQLQPILKGRRYKT